MMSDYTEALQKLESLRKVFIDLHLAAQFKADRKRVDDVERSYFAGQAAAYLTAVEELKKLGL